MSIHSELIKAIRQAYAHAKKQDKDIHKELDKLSNTDWAEDLQNYSDDVNLVLHAAVLEAVKAFRQEQARKRAQVIQRRERREGGNPK